MERPMMMMAMMMLVVPLLARTFRHTHKLDSFAARKCWSICYSSRLALAELTWSGLLLMSGPMCDWWGCVRRLFSFRQNWLTVNIRTSHLVCVYNFKQNCLLWNKIYLNQLWFKPKHSILVFFLNWSMNTLMLWPLQNISFPYTHIQFITNKCVL